MSSAPPISVPITLSPGAAVGEGLPTFLATPADTTIDAPATDLLPRKDVVPGSHVRVVSIPLEIDLSAEIGYGNAAGLWNFIVRSWSPDELVDLTAELPRGIRLGYDHSSDINNTILDGRETRLEDLIAAARAMLAPTDRTTEVRVLAPSDFARQVYSWAFGAQHRATPFVSVMIDANDAIRRNEVLSEDIAGRLRDTEPSLAALAQGVLRDFRDLCWIRLHSDQSNTSPVSHVFHDVGNRFHGWDLLGMGMRMLLQGTSLDEDTRDILAGWGSLELPRILVSSASLASEGNGRTLSLEGIEGARVADPDVADAITTVMSSLVSNAYRYSDPLKGEQRVEITSRILADSSVEVTITDNGIGIEDVDRIGEYRRREGRKVVEGSQGIGLNSVVATLRRLGFGPLWVRSELNAGSSFRFVIPARALEWDKGTRISTSSDDRHLFERYLDEGFVVPAASMDLAIKQALAESPAYRFSGRVEGVNPTTIIGEGWYHSSHDDYPGVSLAKLITSGEVEYPRLKIIARLLAGAKGPGGTFAIENATGFFIDTALTLALLGAMVLIKDPNDQAHDHVTYVLEKHVRDDLAQHIGFAPTLESVAIPTPSPLVFWTHPDQHLQPPAGMTLPGYFARDVAPGGYLVVQADIRDYHSLAFNPDEWELVYSENLFEHPILWDSPPIFVMPSVQWNTNESALMFHIFRRRAR